MTEVYGKCCFIHAAADFSSQVQDEVMRNAMRVCAAVPVEISDSVHWNVEIPYHLSLSFPQLLLIQPGEDVWRISDWI